MTDSGTADYGPDLMNSVFILGLSDSYTREKLFQLQPKAEKKTVEFYVLVRAASEIQQAKDNCLDAGSSSMCGLSGQQAEGGKKPKASFCCNKTTHSDKGFSWEIREKYCKAFKAMCQKCEKIGHFTENCSKEKAVPKKAKVSVLTAEEKGAEAAVPPVTESRALSEAPAAALNSVEQVRPPYQFNPERYQDYRMEDSGWWSVEAVKPIQTKRVWARMEPVSLGPALGHYIFDNVNKVWKSAPPPSQAAGREEVPASGSSLRSSRFESSRAELESTTAREGHRSMCLLRGRASVHSTQQVTGDPPASEELAEFIQYTEGDRVHEGQVTLDIVSMHNVDFPQNKVTLSDLKPSYDPEF